MYPTYAQVKLQSGQEKTVSLRDLAPLPGPVTSNTEDRSPDSPDPPSVAHPPPVSSPSSSENLVSAPPRQSAPAPTTRRSSRNVERVDYSEMGG